ncbi:MAG: M13 family metallopeptidase [Novosphingobium sp.]|jgi:putative endopeptidase|nr:M13 family metallopeptidase [Novosphingobium sp.]
MILRASTLLAATSALALGFASPVLAETAPAAAAPAAQPAVPAAKAAPAWGWGIQLDYMDRSAKPGDDFDRFVNGKWHDATAIPADRSVYGSFIELAELSEQRMKAIIEEVAKGQHPAGSDQARIAAVFNAYMDTAGIEKAGLNPARPMLNQIKAAKTTTDLVKLFVQPGLASPIGMGVSPDAKNSRVNALYAGQAQLGLPDRDNYLVDSPRNREIIAKYKEYLTFLATELGYADPAATVEAVFQLEKKLAAENWDRALSRNRDLTYDKMPIADFLALAPNVPLRTALDALGVGGATEIIVTRMPPTKDELEAAKFTPEMAAKLGGGVPALVKLIASEPIETWKAWLSLQYVSGRAAVLPKRFDDAQFAFYGKFLQGQPEQRPRWKRALSATEGTLGELTGKVYVERHFPATHKAAMDKLVGNLRTAMAYNLQNLTWMGSETRVQAKAKLDAFSLKIGHPDKFKEYKGLNVTPTSAFANADAAARWFQNDRIQRLGKPVDRTEWFMTPQTVNAYYNPTGNEIVFPAGILQPPFFALSADDAVNYGAIGAVIGHEIGHGFDDQGSKSDGDGNLRDWWTPQDKANFQKLTGALADQYSKLCPLDDGKTCINGRLALGENIGDVGGLSLAYRAYKLSLGGKEAPVIDGFTGDQRFFMAWAQVWRTKFREAALRQQLQNGPHSPGMYRILGVVRNFDEWYKAFDVKPGDKMYLPPEERIRIW